MPESSIRIIGFCCRNALDLDQDLAEKGVLSFEPAIKIVLLPCSSKVETLGIIKAFESGADGIFVLGCRENKCRLLDGNRRAQKIVNYTQGLLDEIGIETDRLEMFQLGMPESENFNQVAQAVTEKIESLGKA